MGGRGGRMRAATALGLAGGVVADLVFGDPRHGHPVAGFGRVARWLEGRAYADDRTRGALYAGACVTAAAATGVVAERLTDGRPIARALVTAAATWAVIGGTSLTREAHAMADELAAGDLDAARARVPHLCARDPRDLDAKQIARATVESVAENTSDAVVAPLLWGAVAGVPGLLAYRAVNTLDAMVGYRNDRYLRFGWAAARLDDVANWLPARVTGLLTAACAPVAHGSAYGALRVLYRDGAHHPSPNAGRCEASVAGALDLRLGGTNTYAGHHEHRPELGDGRPPEVSDIPRAARLARATTLTAASLAVAVRLLPAPASAVRLLPAVRLPLVRRPARTPAVRPRRRP